MCFNYDWLELKCENYKYSWKSLSQYLPSILETRAEITPIVLKHLYNDDENVILILSYFCDSFESLCQVSFLRNFSTESPPVYLNHSLISNQNSRDCRTWPPAWWAARGWGPRPCRRESQWSPRPGTEIRSYGDCHDTRHPPQSGSPGAPLRTCHWSVVTILASDWLIRSPIAQSGRLLLAVHQNNLS